MLNTSGRPISLLPAVSLSVVVAALPPTDVAQAGPDRGGEAAVLTAAVAAASTGPVAPRAHGMKAAATPRTAEMSAATALDDFNNGPSDERKAAFDAIGPARITGTTATASAFAA